MRLFKKYYKGYNRNPNKLEELVKLFYAGKDANTNQYGLYGKELIKKITTEFKKGEFFFRTPEEIIDFDFLPDAKGMEKMFNASPAGKIIKRMIDNRIYSEQNTAGFPQSKLKDEALGLARNVIDQITMVRMLGVNTNEIFDIEGSVIASLEGLGKDVFKHEKRSIAYSYLNNKFRQTMRNLDYQKSVNKNKDSFLVQELVEELASISTSIQAIEKISMKALGEQIDNIKVRQIQTTTKSKSYPNKSGREQHIYRVPGSQKIDAEMVKSLEFGDPKGLSFYRTVNAKDKAILQKGYSYIILENPLIGRYMTDANVKNGYAWHLSTKDIDFRNFIAPENIERFVGDITDVKQTISYNFSKRMKQAAETPIYSKDIHGIGTIQEQNLLSNFFKQYASKDFKKDKSIDNLDPAMVQNLALQLLTPDSIVRSYVHGSGTNKMPNFTVNKRLQKALFKWLHDSGYLDLISERIKLHADHLSAMEMGLNPKDIDRIKRSELLYEGDYKGALSRFEDRVDLATSILGDEFNITGRLMSEILANEGVVKNISGEYVELHGAEALQINHKTIKVKPIKSGDLNNQKKIEICP